MARNSQNSRKPARKSTNSGSFGGVMDMARERPVAAVAAAAGAAAAGVFLWSKRAQISDQLGPLSDQIGEWSDTLVADRSSAALDTVDNTAAGTRTSPPKRRIRATTSGRRSNAGNGSALTASNSGGPVA